MNHFPTPELLARVAQHLSDGSIRIPLSDVVTLTEAVDALNLFSASHHQGKVAIIAL